MTLFRPDRCASTIKDSRWALGAVATKEAMMMEGLHAAPNAKTHSGRIFHAPESHCWFVPRSTSALCFLLMYNGQMNIADSCCLPHAHRFRTSAQVCFDLRARLGRSHHNCGRTGRHLVHMALEWRIGTSRAAGSRIRRSTPSDGATSPIVVADAEFVTRPKV